MDADLFTKGAMATHDGEKSTGNKIFCTVVMCSGFTFVRSSPQEPAPARPSRQLQFCRSRARFNHDLVDITPSPVLARLERSNDRVLRLEEVLRSVFVFRRVAAADVAAGLAEPQMDPRVT